MQIDTHITDFLADDFIYTIDNDKVHEFYPGTMLGQAEKSLCGFTKN